MWANLLCCVRGASAAKVVAITQRYPTALDLLTAYEALPTVSERELLLQDLRFHGTRRIGPTVSRSVYHFLTDEAYDDRAANSDSESADDL